MPNVFFSPFMGSAQSLKSGNTLITETVVERIFEVTPESKMCFEYVNPHFADYTTLKVPELVDIGFNFPANAVFRVYKYTSEQIPWLRLPK